MISRKNILLVIRLVLGGVFVWSGILKILDPLQFAQDVSNYQTFPQDLAFAVALVLPWIELLCGVFLILGVFRLGSTALVSLLLLAFLTLIASTLIRGIDVECGCFGSFSRKVDFKLILTDLVLLSLSLKLFWAWRRPAAD